MFSLFLVLCYFVLIFNIIVPAISEKLRVEYRAFSELSRTQHDAFVCAGGVLATYSFTPFGVKTMIPVAPERDGALVPLRCDERDRAETARLVMCESRDGLTRLSGACEKAYAELFFSP